MHLAVFDADEEEAFAPGCELRDEEALAARKEAEIAKGRTSSSKHPLLFLMLTLCSVLFSS